MNLACPDCRKPGALLCGNCTRCGRLRTPEDNERIRAATDRLMREVNRYRPASIEWGGMDR